ncbi:MAG: formate dehydrogenase subunit alpha, partial [Deltaproteobacteria bacterium]
MDFNLVLTTCPFCGTGCNFYLEVTDGKITGILPCKTHPISRGKLCVLGRNAAKFIYHPDRLKHPLVRRDKDFVRISWDQALLEISKRLI